MGPAERAGVDARVMKRVNQRLRSCERERVERIRSRYPDRTIRPAFCSPARERRDDERSFKSIIPLLTQRATTRCLYIEKIRVPYVTTP